MGIKICWHGCASFSLRMYGQEFLFDPFFLPAAPCPPARSPNGAAPSPADYLRTHWPDLCLITGGRYEHCDLETVRRLGMMRPQLRFLTGDEVAGVLRRSCALADACAWRTEVGDVHHMGTVRVETLAGTLGGPGGGDPRAMGGNPAPDRSTLGEPEPGGATLGDPVRGDEAEAGGRTLGRGDETAAGARTLGDPVPGVDAAPNRGVYADPGAPTRGRHPSGPLGFRLTADLDRVYVSGDTRLSGVPRLDATIAVLCVGGQAAAAWDDGSAADPHPPILGEADLVAALRNLSARVLIPIHWDFAGFAPPLDIRGLQRRVAEEMPAVTVIVPPYNEWIEVEA